MSPFLYLFTYAINLWHRKFVTTDVNAVFVNNQHGIKRRGQDFDKNCRWRGTQQRGWQTNFPRKAEQSVVLTSCWKSCGTQAQLTGGHAAAYRAVPVPRNRSAGQNVSPTANLWMIQIRRGRKSSISKAAGGGYVITASEIKSPGAKNSKVVFRSLAAHNRTNQTKSWLKCNVYVLEHRQINRQYSLENKNIVRISLKPRNWKRRRIRPTHIADSLFIWWPVVAVAFTDGWHRFIYGRPME